MVLWLCVVLWCGRVEREYCAVLSCDEKVAVIIQIDGCIVCNTSGGGGGGIRTSPQTKEFLSLYISALSPRDLN